MEYPAASGELRADPCDRLDVELRRQFLEANNGKAAVLGEEFVSEARAHVGRDHQRRSLGGERQVTPFFRQRVQQRFAIV